MADADALNCKSRLSALEERSVCQATKLDLANLKADMIKWIIGTQIALAR